jgi:CRISPR type III-B/RAMP module RAMP protein Cmr1
LDEKYEKTYGLTTITPFYGHGRDKKEPEIRASEFKALMRYTFRAVSDEISIPVLFDKESALFGSANDENPNASALRLKMVLSQNGTNQNLLKDRLIFREGKNGNPNANNAKYIKDGFDFNITLRSFNTDNLQIYKMWFELSLALFGVGGRSRRARGCFLIDEPEFIRFQTQEAFLESLVCVLGQLTSESRYTLDGNTITSSRAYTEPSYPYITSISLGGKYNDWKPLLQAVDKSAHENNCIFTGFVSDKNQKFPIYALLPKQTDKKPQKLTRYASPVYVSAVKIGGGLYPLVVNLKEENSLHKFKKDHHDLTEEFYNDKRSGFIKDFIGGQP